MLHQPCSPVVFPPLPRLRVCCVCWCKCSRDACHVLRGLSPVQLHFGNPVCLRSGMGCVVRIVRSFLQLQWLWSIVVLHTALYLSSYCPSTAWQFHRVKACWQLWLMAVILKPLRRVLFHWCSVQIQDVLCSVKASYKLTYG